MTYPQDFRNLPEHAVRQEIQHMSDQTLDRAVRGYGGPTITPRQESILRDEVGRRWEDRQYAAHLANEARRRDFDEYGLDTDRAISAFEEPGFDSFEEPGFDALDSDTPPSTGGDSLGVGDRSRAGDADSATTGTHDLTAEQEEALLLVGAILFEAVLVKRTADTIQAHLNASSELVAADPALPERITERLWTAYDRSERGDRLEAILGGDSDAALAAVETLANELD